MTVFDIAVYLDTVCPWCYIGHRILDQAINLYRKTYPGGSSDVFNFTFLPYYLVPDAPLEGIRMSQRIGDKNGHDRVDAITTRLQRVGRAHGILFDFEGKTGNTKASHRLIDFAGAKGGSELQKCLIEKIFESHFERGGDITSREMLIAAATAVGLPEAEAGELLDSKESDDKVDALAAKARASGVSSVPTISINGTTIEGAEDASVFYQAFVEAKGGSEAASE